MRQIACFSGRCKLEKRHSGNIALGWLVRQYPAQQAAAATQELIGWLTVAAARLGVC
jgi:hypothetical protein